MYSRLLKSTSQYNDSNYEGRFAHNGARARKVGIVALARKLVVVAPERQRAYGLWNVLAARDLPGPLGTGAD